MNKAYCEYFDKSFEELVGSTFLSLIPEADRKTMMDNISALTVESPMHSHEHSVIAPNGDIRWQRWTNRALFDAQGKAVGYMAIGEDITERKRTEQALRESEERFRLVFLTSPDSINLNRADDGMYIDINEGFTNIMGYTREDVIGNTSLSLDIWKNPADRKRLIDGLSKTGYVENLEAQFVGKDGKVRVGLMSARILRISDENVILSITRDITQHKKGRGCFARERGKVSDACRRVSVRNFFDRKGRPLQVCQPSVPGDVRLHDRRRSHRKGMVPESLSG